MQQSLTNIGMTVHLQGHLKTGHDYCHGLESGGCRLNAIEKEVLILAQSAADHGGKKLDLVARSLAQLGFDEGEVDYPKIYKRAYERYGDEICPHELIPYLRIQYTHQPKGESLKVAIEPIIDREKNSNIFQIGHDDTDGLWLGAYSFDPEKHIFLAEDRFIFVLGKKCEKSTMP